MKNTLLFFILLSISEFTQGQNLFHINEEWNTENNIVGNLEFVDSAMDSNKGIVTVGSELIVNEGINAFVQYVNSQGQLLWEISYDYQGGDDYATGIYIDSQDDIYICGVAYDVTDDNYDGLLMKVNTQGQTVFSTVFDQGTNLNNYFTDIYVRQGKSYVCGTVENNPLDYDILTVGFDTSGQMEWDVVFGSTSDFDIGSTINGYSGGIIVSGG